MSEPPPRPRRAPRRDPRLTALAEESGYEIGPRIATGGMGIVYRATDADGRDVAVKLLRPEIADDPRARARLAREVASQQRVRHPGIARILDAELDSADAFVATEFIPGPTLEDAVRDHGGLHPEMVREIGVALGECLRDIHAAGIVHRDLKPSNVLLRDARESDLTVYDPHGAGLDPVIIDFGIAQAAEESRLTSTGLVMGTAAYLDPEVVRTNRTGPASDWWSWAALIAFAATGREPFGSGRADLVFLRAERGELDVDGLPSELAAWLREALRSDPADRTDPEELLARLDALDLERYDDPGATEVIGGGSAGAGGGVGSGATAVLPAAGMMGVGSRRHGEGAAPSARGDATDVLPLGAGTDADDEDPDAVDDDEDDLGGVDADDDAARTEVLPRIEGGPGSHAMANLGEEPPTEALPSIGAGDDAGDGADDDAGDHAGGEAAGPATEVLPTVRAETAVLPVVRDPEDPGAGRGVFPGVTGAGAARQSPERPMHAAGHTSAPAPAVRSFSPAAADQAVRPRRPDDPAYLPPAPQAVPQQAPPQYAPPQRALAQQALAQRPPAQQGCPGYPAGPGTAFEQGYPGSYGAQVAPQYPPVVPAPRRRVLAWLGHAVLIAVGAVAPYVALTLMVLLGALARTWQRSWRSLERARYRAGGSGTVTAGFAAPFRFLLGALEIALTMIFPLILGLLVAASLDVIATYLWSGPLPAAVLFAVAIAITLLLTWVGIGGRTTRDGTHRMLAAAAPDAVWSAVVGGLLILLLGAVLATIAARGGEVDYVPFLQGPRLEDVLPWRH